MHKKFVIGDIHGGYKALMQCFVRSQFDVNNDKLIVLGDIADGWPDVVECVEALRNVKHLIFVRGNHDQWLIDYLRTEETPKIWLTQGGMNSFRSYNKQPEYKESHKQFLMSSMYYYIDERHRLFVHGGVNPQRPIAEQSLDDLMWSRELWETHVRTAAPVFVPEFAHVYVGHTTTTRLSDTPVTSGNVTFMDTGGGWEGKLSMLNLDTNEVIQSDLVATLY